MKTYTVYITVNGRCHTELGRVMAENEADACDVATHVPAFAPRIAAGVRLGVVHLSAAMGVPCPREPKMRRDGRG